MALNKKAIFEALNKAPLCSGHLIAQRGMATEYCAMGALVKGLGANDVELRHSDDGGYAIYYRYKFELHSKYGIESYDQFASFMEVNDAEQFSTRRNKAVMNHVEALTAEEVNSIIEQPVTSEFHG